MLCHTSYPVMAEPFVESGTVQPNQMEVPETDVLRKRGSLGAAYAMGDTVTVADGAPAPTALIATTRTRCGVPPFRPVRTMTRELAATDGLRTQFAPLSTVYSAAYPVMAEPFDCDAPPKYTLRV